MSGSPGREALREAARLEAARVYGRTCPERATPEPERATPEPGTVAVDLAAARRRRGAA